MGGRATLPGDFAERKRAAVPHLTDTGQATMTTNSFIDYNVTLVKVFFHVAASLDAEVVS